MNKFRLIFVSLMLIITALLVVIFYVKEDKKEEEQLAKIEELQSETVEVNYSEGDEDEQYNYIANPQELNGLIISLDKALSLNDEVNSQLLANNITGEAIYINEINFSQRRYIITMFTAETETNITVTYDTENGEMTVLVEL